MLAPSQEMFSSFIWPLEDPIISQQNNNNINMKTETSGCVLDYFPSSQQQVENGDHSQLDSKTDGKMVKKQYHSAIERDRRKRVNDLYSSLRSLLPGTDQVERLSIPGTVSRVVKYIPELKKELQRLHQKKEALATRMCRLKEYAHFGNYLRKTEQQSKLVVVSASEIGDREIGVQISFLKSSNGSFAEALQSLEQEGFLVLNMSSFESSDGTVFYNLHLELVHETQALDVERLREKLMSFYEMRELGC